MDIQLSDHFNYKRLFRFVLPSIVMMVFTSIYGVVDGFFVSNCAGKTEFAAVNLIMPFLMILGALGFMLGTGGSAVVAMTLGTGRVEKANQIFSLLVYIGFGAGVVIAIVGIVFVEPVAILLGAEGDMIRHCAMYGRIILIALPMFIMQNMFQSFLVTAEKPKLGLLVTVLVGVTNMVLDGIFLWVFRWGVAGAAIATAISQTLGGLIPVIYFVNKNSSSLRLTKAIWDFSTLIKVCVNGSSELVTNISMSLVSMLYNFQLMKYAGENGVAAYGVIMYVTFIFVAIFLGYSIGTAPIVSYNYGAGNKDELKNIFKKSIIFMSCAGVLLAVTSAGLASPLSKMFVGYDKELCDITVRAFVIYSLSFVFCGFSIYGSSLFTALNNGLVSALISFLRTLVFQILAILIMPLIWGLDGIWFSVVVAEVFSVILTAVFVIVYRNKYGYWEKVR